ncbi:5'-methylthioadenosine/adenosylhomocysteine nucleosidase [Labrys wisconsinensis]|uniref:adenosylhomocysteine nucleosidase n=1 Tax=Labrys wisconsinensis TaxID=425677 RepID=A0ABU0JEP5_9HYPH|nr:5'-methylthioadenosine/adenosylhomocysteine nucleosidase [Labrys wisconsinensis]MDQ0471976.1 adenosylhomocysteine nucleosidase [Labrys wisconsinensis]
MSTGQPLADPLGLVAALAQEAAGLIAEMRAEARTELVRAGGRDFHVGQLFGRPCVLTLARIGKVAAATTATALIHRFDVGAILFTGVAGGAGQHVRVGDIVLGETLLQHDLDASPIFPRWEVPLSGLSRFATDPALSERLEQAVAGFLAEDFLRLPETSRARLGLTRPALHKGLIVSGDRFVNGHAAVAQLRADLPDALAIEMEGAAVAQVCHDYGVPCAVIRTISDAADDSAHIDFPVFLSEVASHYSYAIVRRFLTGG